MFSGGTLQTLATLLWRMIDLVTRYGMAGHPLIWAITPVDAHAYLMIYNLSPAWLACFAPWVLRHLPACWRAQADGRSG